MILNRIPLIFLGVMAVLAVSGCTMPWGTTTAAPAGYGLVITDFYLTPTEVYSGKKISLYSYIENQGGVATSNALICLMGANFPGDFEDGMWQLGHGTDTETSVCKNVGKALAAPDKTKNVPGGSANKKWILTAPAIPEKMSRTDTFTTRVFYTYDSKATTSFWVYTESEEMAIRQRGEGLPSTLSVDETTAPVDIALDAVQPVIVSSGSAGESFTLKITLSNVGGGTIVSGVTFADSTTIPSIAEGNLNKISLLISKPSGITISCGESLSNIELIRGGTYVLTCDVTVTDTTLTAKKSYPITVSASYGYYIESSTSATVIGKIVDTTPPGVTFNSISYPSGQSNFNVTKAQANDKTQNATMSFMSTEDGTYGLVIHKNGDPTTIYKTFSSSLIANTQAKETWFGDSGALYVSAGTYLANLTVADNAGNTANSVQYIVVIS